MVVKKVVVGDMHVQIKNLKDCNNLIDFIIQTAKENDINEVLFLGDLFHTHAVIRVEIIDFWKNAFQRFEIEGMKVVVLVGNHDQPGSREKEQEMNALNVFEDDPITSGRIIINEPQIVGNIAYIPYMSNEEEFVKAAHKLYNEGATGLLVAHQTFTGAQYENGFFSEEGIDPALIPQEQILSGHIHMTQQIGKCFYPGTPKWDTMSDANQKKNIWIFEHHKSGVYGNKRWVSTENVVTPITSYIVLEGEEIPELNPDARNHVVLEGKSSWITKMKKKLKNLANIKVKPTDRKSIASAENSITLEKYLETEFEPIAGVSKKEIKEHLVNL